jgi:hypothetical protein
MSACGTKQTCSMQRMTASGAKSRLTNRCLPISIYEYTPPDYARLLQRHPPTLLLLIARSSNPYTLPLFVLRHRPVRDVGIFGTAKAGRN